MENDEEVVVYHGTTKNCATSIISMNKFIPGEDIKNEDYLGKGIYFFDNYEHAILWNIRDYYMKETKEIDYDTYSNNYDIVEALIKVNKANILDLDTQKNIAKFDKLVNKIEKTLNALPEYLHARNKNAAILNYLQKNGYIDDVYLVKQKIKQTLRVSKLHSFNYIYREVICVKNDKIIKLIELHDNISEDDFDSAAYLSFRN